MRQYTKQEKQEWLAEWKTSGVSANTFAEDKPFSPSSLQYWKRKFKSTPQSSFIQVIPDTTTNSPYVRITYPSGIVLDLFSVVNLAEVKGLVQ